METKDNIKVGKRWKESNYLVNEAQAVREYLWGKRRRQNKRFISHFLLGCSDHGVESEGALSTVSPYSNQQSLCGCLVPQCPVKSCQNLSD